MKKEPHELASWSMIENHFENNTIRYTKLATSVSGRKNVARPFVRRQQVNTSAELVPCCYISALVLTCYRLTKGRATFFQPETIVVSFLHFMVLSFKGSYFLVKTNVCHNCNKISTYWKMTNLLNISYDRKFTCKNGYT